MSLEAAKIVVVQDGFSPRLELRAGNFVLGKTLTQQDMQYLADAFLRHGEACAAIKDSMSERDLDVPRWQHRMQAHAAERKVGRNR